jgi:hypothetical protein
MASVPKTADVAASPAKIAKKERSATSPATAGPAAKPRLIASRYAAKAVTRRPCGTRSARSALDAGRYDSAARPASAVSGTISARLPACDSASITTDEEYIESAIVPRRPTWSARTPPAAAAEALPMPYAESASPAWATL